MIVFGLALTIIGLRANVSASHNHLTDFHAHDSEAPSHSDMPPSDMPHGDPLDHEIHDHDEHEHGNHTHEMLEIPSDAPVPTVDLIVHPDTMRGWNLEVQVTNFQFAPERVNQSSLTNEGHAHLYVNGEKITRLYGSWYYLPELPPGHHEIMVELNANGHEVLAVNGVAIADTEMLMVPEVMP
jgi:hypothetical protein